MVGGAGFGYGGNGVVLFLGGSQRFFIDLFYYVWVFLGFFS